MLVQLLFILFLITGILILAFSLGQLSLLLLYLHKRGKKNINTSLLTHPLVTIQLPVYNEINVVERLINGVIKLEYPKNLLYIQVLDDSTDDTTKLVAKKVAECKQLGYHIEHVKRENRSGFKAGALQFGLELCHTEFIAIFDADFVPDPNFLIDILPSFTSPSIGMVQTRWDYFNADHNWLTNVQKMALDGHFIIDQEARYKNGLFMNFNGTAGIWRTACLRDAGGWNSRTLTEDLDISYLAQLKKWEFVYRADQTNQAELPTKIRAVINQQFRWVKGSVETSLKILPLLLQSDFSWSKKAGGTFHLLSNYVYLIVLINGMLSLPILVLKQKHTQLESLLNFSPIMLSVFFVNLFYCYAAAYEYNSRKNTIPRFISTFLKLVLLYLGMSLNNARAIIEAILGYKTDFIRTPKYNSGENHANKKNYEFGFQSIKILPEILAFLYFIAGVFLAFHLNDYTFLAYHLLLLSGYGVIIITSIQDHRKVQSIKLS